MRYELIKEYPGSPTLGTIVELDVSTIRMDNSHLLSNYFCYREPGGRKVHLLNSYVRNYPEYYKEITDESNN